MLSMVSSSLLAVASSAVALAKSSACLMNITRWPAMMPEYRQGSCSLCEAYLSEDEVGVFFPQSWRFWIALHCRIYWYHITWRYGWSLLMEGPPVMDGFVRLYIESLFRWWGFGKLETSAPYILRFSPAATT